MINYNLINKSINFYDTKGFKRIETPWMVTEYVDSITRPKDSKPYEVPIKKKNLIASGEQGFLYLYLKNHLPKGTFQTVTPCFRDDPFDLTHSKYFIKNELIKTDSTSGNDLDEVISISFEFFSGLVGKNNLNIIPTEEGFDINYFQVELGSYGIRSCEFLTWIYGTGCAEPRMSAILNKHGIPYN